MLTLNWTQQPKLAGEISIDVAHTLQKYIRRKTILEALLALAPFSTFC